ncbi:MAG: hypothetical protein JWM80_5967 [Cyanobacteria bacterium RYN_339]|nr:hypothetical protein [Cyanobacteria bacterium RYN_339]
MAADPLPPELLAAWLEAPDEDARQAVMARYAPELGPDGAELLLALATAGPAYGGDRERELALQRELLELARGVAEHQQAWLVAAHACRHLAHVDVGARRSWLERAARHAITGAGWEVLSRTESDLAALALVSRQPREALAAASRSLAACRHEPASRALGELGDEAAQALVEMATRLGDPQVAFGPLKDWLAHTRQGGELELIARACERLGGVAAMLDRAGDAERWLGEAAALYAELMEGPPLARVLLRRLAVAAGTGDPDAVAGRVADLVSLRERTTDPEVRALIDDADFRDLEP